LDEDLRGWRYLEVQRRLLHDHHTLFGEPDTMKDATYYDEVYAGRYHVDEDRVRYVASLCTGRVLDVGCGDGRLAEFVEGDYLGLDFSQIAIDLAAHRQPGKAFVVRDFTRQALPKGPWDTIVLGELLEHLDDAAQAVLLDKCQKVLAGHIVATVPKADAVPDVAHVRVFEDGTLAKALGVFGPTVTHAYSDRYLVISSHMKRPKLSAVLIVKDEEELLGRCLDSVKDIWDELVIVDTGSTDRTVEIAKSYGARIGHFPWRSDFAAARNYAESLCFGEYVLWLDADVQVLEGQQAIREIVEAGELDGIAPFLIFSRDSEDRPATTYSWLEMLHRNDGRWRWQGAAHNWLNGTGRIERKDIIFEHIPRSGGKRVNHEDIFEALRANFGVGLPERQLFYLAREHFYKRHWHECIGVVSLMMQTPAKWPIQRSRALLLAGDCWLALGEQEAARQTYLKAIAEHPGWAEPYFWLGKLAHVQKKYTEAIGWFLASTAYDPSSSYFADQGLYSWSRWDALALSCYKAGRYTEAVDYGRKALLGKPEDERLIENLRWYEAKL
jgi:glycosyltransferase involved in cell wall biosynthesis/2-polyprenyl-3-methyl-5-hydroxy-6-metoxy-1,4-benzoquinol methylase